MRRIISHYDKKIDLNTGREQAGPKKKENLLENGKALKIFVPNNES